MTAPSATAISLFFGLLFSVLARASVAGPGARGQGQVVLVVDDDEEVCELVCRILESGGYTVLSAKTGAQALELGRHPDKTIQMLITDVVLPDIDGFQVAQSMLEKHADLKVLYMSGYAGNIPALRGLDLDAVEFLSKPFRVGELLERVRVILGAS